MTRKNGPGSSDVKKSQNKLTKKDLFWTANKWQTLIFNLQWPWRSFCFKQREQVPKVFLSHWIKQGIEISKRTNRGNGNQTLIKTWCSMEQLQAQRLKSRAKSFYNYSTTIPLHSITDAQKYTFSGVFVCLTFQIGKKKSEKFFVFRSKLTLFCPQWKLIGVETAFLGNLTFFDSYFV